MRTLYLLSASTLITGAICAPAPSDDSGSYAASLGKRWPFRFFQVPQVGRPNVFAAYLPRLSSCIYPYCTPSDYPVPISTTTPPYPTMHTFVAANTTTSATTTVYIAPPTASAVTTLPQYTATAVAPALTTTTTAAVTTTTVATTMTTELCDTPKTTKKGKVHRPTKHKPKRPTIHRPKKQEYKSPKNTGYEHPKNHGYEFPENHGYKTTTKKVTTTIVTTISMPTRVVDYDYYKKNTGHGPVVYPREDQKLRKYSENYNGEPYQEPAKGSTYSGPPKGQYGYKKGKVTTTKKPVNKPMTTTSPLPPASIGLEIEYLAPVAYTTATTSACYN
ncbi:hypothetical protein AA313_de0202343 [Arthrobotrys entomopaga]|nr:hypothetical protein AA313_de0202343 [Arthrobotrys entomopaga]